MIGWAASAPGDRKQFQQSTFEGERRRNITNPPLTLEPPQQVGGPPPLDGGRRRRDLAGAPSLIELDHHVSPGCVLPFGVLTAGRQKRERTASARVPAATDLLEVLAFNDQAEVWALVRMRRE